MKKEKIILQKSSILNLDKRLNEVMKHLLIKDPIAYKTKQQVAEKINFGRTNLSSALNGTKKYLTDGLVDKFVTAFPELNRDWLLTGTGEMLINEEEKQIKEKERQLVLIDKYFSNSNITDEGQILSSAKEKTELKALIPIDDKQRGCPLIPIEAIAGFGTGDNEGVSYENCDHYIVPEFDKRGMDFLIRVSGSSMYPKYSNGDVLACKKIDSVTFFQWGKVYVIDSVQGALVKRIFEDKDNPDNIICVSDNKENYPPFPMPKSEIRSLSIVLGVVRME